MASPQYCSLCNHSHELSYRHLYTKKHKSKVENACKKLKEKVNV